MQFVEAYLLLGLYSVTESLLHIQALSALYALQVPCHGPGLSCDADSVGPSHMETGVGLSIAME